MFQKLHKKAVHLALSVGGSALVAHRTRAGHVQLSATHNVLCAVTSLRTGGEMRDLLRQLIGSADTLVNLDWLDGLGWLEEAQHPVRAGKALTDAWRQGTRWLGVLAAAADAQQRPYLVHVFHAGKQLSLGSSEGRELMSRSAWDAIVGAACRAPRDIPPGLEWITAAPAQRHWQAAPPQPQPQGAASGGGSQRAGSSKAWRSRSRSSHSNRGKERSWPPPAQRPLLAHLDPVYAQRCKLLTLQLSKVGSLCMHAIMRPVPKPRQGPLRPD